MYIYVHTHICVYIYIFSLVADYHPMVPFGQILDAARCFSDYIHTYMYIYTYTYIVSLGGEDSCR